MGSRAVTRIAVALCLCLAGAAVSGVLLGQHHGEPLLVSKVNEACGNGETSGCEDVARSSWSSVAGLPVAAYGLVFYLSLSLLLALALFAPADLRDPMAGVALALLALGLLVDLVLLGVQAFAIRAYCRFCILTYLLSAGALVTLVPAWRAARLAGAAAARIDGRLAVAGWVLGTLALTGAVLASDTTLAARALRRQATLLGAPAPAPAAEPATAPATPAPAAPSPGARAATEPPAASSPAPSPTGPQDAKFWQERAQKLQATLDDPRKLDAYFAEKAQREFDAATPVSIALDGTPDKGPATAPVTVAEYSDFMCPYCRNLGLALSQFVPTAGGRVAVYFKNFPLDKTCNERLPGSTHPGACNLALGSICARYQGKFEAYHDRVFSTELRNPQAADVVRIAGEAGLNAAAVQGCLEDPKAKVELAAEIAEGNRLGVNSTPTIYVNGKKLPRINDFVAVVDKEARKKGFPPLAP
ncbi:MAG TPA: thioredoxin domain-containing protein [Vicinamibacteria bacterium]|nr:thioredoxin domain-containing protein [Vicinamibacteria bacterium]